MIGNSQGSEEVECSEIVYRALKRAWVDDKSVFPEAFMRRPSDDAISISRSKYDTARECRLKLKNMRATASLHVGIIRNLPEGLDVAPDPVCNDEGDVIDPGHCLLVNLPNRIIDPNSAEFAATQLTKIARIVTPEDEEKEHKTRRSS